MTADAETTASGPGVPVMAVASAAPVAPAIRFGEGRRPETATRVQVAEFEGPLGLLLSLIEARQLDVLTVPLGGLADAYLDALATLDADRLGNVSSFVAVASQLILIKSRAMLPRQQPADPTAQCTAPCGTCSSRPLKLLKLVAVIAPAADRTAFERPDVPLLRLVARAATRRGLGTVCPFSLT